MSHAGWTRLVALSGRSAIGAVAVLAATGTVLSFVYRPEWSSGGRVLDDGTNTLVDLHEIALVVGLVATATWAAVLVMSRVTGTTRRLVDPVLAVLALVLVGAASVAWTASAWDQVALRSVAVGTDIRGLWFPAFDSEVAFVLVDGVQVSQRNFAVWVVVHLLAPIAALVAVVVSWRRTSTSLAAIPLTPPDTEDEAAASRVSPRLPS